VSKAARHLIAFDLGAESGRGILGQFDGQRLQLTELHRFANEPVRIFDRLYWDPLRLFAQLKVGLQAFSSGHGRQLHGMGMDTWGVDFALLGRDGSLLENPRHYRDARTDGMLELAFERVPREEIFERSGAQFMKLNTLYQLLAMKEQASPVLEAAAHFLMMPDLFNYFFTGERVSEFTDATTTQFYDPRQGRWSTELLDKLLRGRGPAPRHRCRVRSGSRAGAGAGYPRHGIGRGGRAGNRTGLRVHQLGYVVVDGCSSGRAHDLAPRPAAQFHQ